MTLTLHQGDARLVLRRLIDSGVRVQSIVTDPPYGLVSVHKRFGKKGSAPARTEGNDGSFARLSGGFMGKAWDATEVERDPAFWRLCLEVLLPGGYCFAFSGARTGHWQAVAMEQAGFIMHPMHGWVYGSGFPKAHDAARAVEKAGGDAEAWEGWAYGTQAQKPALEPIYLAQRPYSEKTGAANLMKHGVGAVNIDACRVPTGENLNGGAYAKNPTERAELFGEEAGNSWRRGGAGKYVQPEGRYPANLLHDGSDEVKALFPNSQGSGPARKLKRGERPEDSGWGMGDKEGELRDAGSGSAARFFNSFPDAIEEIEVEWIFESEKLQATLLVDTGQSPPKVIAASGLAENREWNTFLFGNSTKEKSQKVSKSIIKTKTNWTIESKTLSWLITSPTKESTAAVLFLPESGSSPAENAEKSPLFQITTNVKTGFHLGANLVPSGAQLKIRGLGRFQGSPVFYHAKAGKKDRSGSRHPTVKPVGLLRHLVKHITPPGGTVLDPFAGSGTTAEAARAEGFDCVLIEQEPDYADFIRERFDLPPDGFELI